MSSSNSSSREASPHPSRPAPGTSLNHGLSHLTQPHLSTTNRHSLPPADLQRKALAKLLNDPARPVHIPKPKKSGGGGGGEGGDGAGAGGMEGLPPGMRPAREMMRNVQGSSAGAGSGEFHVYKQSRRREYERIKGLEELEKKKSLDALFLARQSERQAVVESKTSRNRTKRQKRRNRQEKAKANGGSNKKRKGDDDDDDDEDEEEGSDDEKVGKEKEPEVKRRRLLGGGATESGVKFKTAAEREEEEDLDQGKGEEDMEQSDAEEDGKGLGIGSISIPLKIGERDGEAETKAAEERGLEIKDDD